MELVGAALGGNLHLGARKAAGFGVIAIGDNLYTFDRIFTRRNHCRSAPDGAGGADAIDRNPVILGLAAVGDCLRAVLGREYASRSARSRSSGLRAGNVI